MIALCLINISSYRTKCVKSNTKIDYQYHNESYYQIDKKQICNKIKECEYSSRNNINGIRKFLYNTDTNNGICTCKLSTDIFYLETLCLILPYHIILNYLFGRFKNNENNNNMVVYRLLMINYLSLSAVIAFLLLNIIIICSLSYSILITILYVYMLLLDVLFHLTSISSINIYFTINEIVNDIENNR